MKKEIKKFYQILLTKLVRSLLNKSYQNNVFIQNRIKNFKICGMNI